MDFFFDKWEMGGKEQNLAFGLLPGNSTTTMCPSCPRKEEGSELEALLLQVHGARCLSCQKPQVAELKNTSSFRYRSGVQYLVPVRLDTKLNNIKTLLVFLCQQKLNKYIKDFGVISTFSFPHSIK